MEQRFISMDNEKDIKLSGKITIEETKEYAVRKWKISAWSWLQEDVKLINFTKMVKIGDNG